MEVIVLMFLLLWGLWWITVQTFPGPMRLVQRAVRALTRRVIALTWSGPVRRFGPGRTVWLWAVALAVLVTIQTITASELTIGLRLVVVLQLWLLVAAGWWVLLCLARRHFQARPLPQRRPRRRQ